MWYSDVSEALCLPVPPDVPDSALEMRSPVCLPSKPKTFHRGTLSTSLFRRLGGTAKDGTVGTGVFFTVT